jgi:predicted transcriptional regulator
VSFDRRRPPTEATEPTSSTCPSAAVRRFVGFKAALPEFGAMSSIELTPSQKSILRALVNLHREREDAVKGEDIAEEVDRNPGTIRNQMQSLKALQLVEGVPGPKGGYKPTATAYEALDVQRMDEPAAVALHVDGEQLEGVNVESINLTSVHHPELCRAELHLQGSIGDVHEGDAVSVGPTPLSKLVVEGTVDGKDETANVLLVKIEGMEAPATEPDH